MKVELLNQRFPQAHARIVQLHLDAHLALNYKARRAPGAKYLDRLQAGRDERHRAPVEVVEQHNADAFHLDRRAELRVRLAAAAGTQRD